MADVWATSMACHPTATCHIVGCNNSIRHIENSFSPFFILFLFFNAVWALTSGGFRIVSDTLVLNALLSLESSNIMKIGLMKISLQETDYGQAWQTTQCCFGPFF